MKNLLSGVAFIALAAAAPAFAQDAPVLGDFGFDVTGMNAELDPGDDFFQFANQAWLERTEIPSDRSNYGMFM